MTAQEILDDLRLMGKESCKRVMLKHGVQEPIYGVSIADMKPIQKEVKKSYQLSKDLFDTGVYEAMYLAGLIADDAAMTPNDLEDWLAKANCSAIWNVTVAWVAAGSNHGWELALKWIDQAEDKTRCAGWATLSGWVALRPDSELDIVKLHDLLTRVQSTIHDQPDALKYQMNGFVIAVGSYVASLNLKAMKVGEAIGRVDIDLVGDCKLPPICEYIKKVEDRGKIGAKRKTVKC